MCSVCSVGVWECVFVCVRVVMFVREIVSGSVYGSVCVSGSMSVCKCVRKL